MGNMSKRNIYIKIDEGDLETAKSNLENLDMRYRLYYYDPMKIVCEEYAEKELETDMIILNEDEPLYKKTEDLSEYIYKDMQDDVNSNIFRAVYRDSFNHWAIAKNIMK